eukprot:561936_1
MGPCTLYVSILMSSLNVALTASLLEFHVDPSYTLPDTRLGTARVVYDDYFYMIGGSSAGGKKYHNMIRTPIHEHAPNYTEWEVIPLTFRTSRGYHCFPNCGLVFEDKHVMYTIGRYMNYGNGDNWAELYVSYKYDFTTSTLSEMNWDETDGFIGVYGACVTSNKIDTIYVIGGLNATAAKQSIVQIYNINANAWLQTKYLIIWKSLIVFKYLEEVRSEYSA